MGEEYKVGGSIGSCKERMDTGGRGIAQDLAVRLWNSVKEMDKTSIKANKRAGASVFYLSGLGTRWLQICPSMPSCQTGEPRKGMESLARYLVRETYIRSNNVP